MTPTRQAYAHDAVVVMKPGSDPNALGGAITVALCGHWEHEPPCPLAPHHTTAVTTGDGNAVTVRVLFAAQPQDERRARALIAEALAAGTITGPDGNVSTWKVRSAGPGTLRPEETEQAARLVDN